MNIEPTNMTELFHVERSWGTFVIFANKWVMTKEGKRSNGYNQYIFTAKHTTIGEICEHFATMTKIDKSWELTSIMISSDLTWLLRDYQDWSNDQMRAKKEKQAKEKAA